ncbi:hypothetical protein VUR80DRAFT_9471 [Thermomyces stellatus]
MDAVPAKLKPAEVGRFIHRANQLRHVKPAMTYWCEYYAVNQILSKQLHNADEECLAYTSALMDRLEQLKAEHAEDDAIADDTAGQAYVEQFAQQTFERGEKVLRANKVTRYASGAPPTHRSIPFCPSTYALTSRRPRPGAPAKPPTHSTRQPPSSSSSASSRPWMRRPKRRSSSQSGTRRASSAP